jgi:hypothetical protein
MMMGADVGVVIGCSSRRVAMSVRVTMSVRVEVTDMSRCRRQMMLGAKRVIQDEGKRRQHRKGGGGPFAQQMGETNHPYT